VVASEGLGLGDALAADGPVPFAGEALGVNATALGFGLNDDALTFRRAVGEVGVSLFAGTGVVDLGPLKGGIACMNNPVRFVAGSGAFPAVVFGVEVDATILAPDAALGGAAVGCPRAEGEGVMVVVPACPIARAESESAS
jgi:hypothetical protein